MQDGRNAIFLLEEAIFTQLAATDLRDRIIVRFDVARARKVTVYGWHEKNSNIPFLVFEKTKEGNWAYAPVPGQPIMGALDSLEALRAWADAAIEHQEQNGGRGECTLGSLAGELIPAESTQDHDPEGMDRGGVPPDAAQPRGEDRQDRGDDGITGDDLPEGAHGNPSDVGSMINEPTARARRGAGAGAGRCSPRADTSATCGLCPAVPPCKEPAG